MLDNTVKVRQIGISTFGSGDVCNLLSAVRMFNQHLKEMLLIVIIGSIRIIHYMRDEINEILVAGLHVHDKVVQYLHKCCT